MGKIPMDIKSTTVRSVGISGRPRHLSTFTHELRIILITQFVGKQCMCIMIESITSTTPIGSAGILVCVKSLLIFQSRPCPNCSVRWASNGCAILTV